MHEIRFSLFSHARDGIPKPMSCTWEEFVNGLGPHRFDIADKKRVPAFSPAEFRPGMPRQEKFVVRIWFGVLDLDLVTTAQLATVASRLEGLDAVLYTTWGHPEAWATKGLWKVRICIRFNRPAELREWHLIWPAMSTFFGGLNDPNMTSANEIYFGPSVPPTTDPGICHFIVFRGNALDLDRLPVSAYGEGPKPIGAGTEKITRERLDRLAKRWAKNRDPYRAEMGDILGKIVKGESFAEPGNRDEVLFKICSDLAVAFPKASSDSVADLFAQSLQICGTDLKQDLDKVREKLERAQEKAAAELYAEEMAQVSERKLRIRQAFAHIDPERDWSYTEDELNEMAHLAKCTREELRKRWIIQRASSFYLMGPKGVYSQPYTDKDVINAVLRDLAPSDSAGVELWDQGNNGPVRKNMTALMSEYGSVATDTVLDMRAQYARYEASQKLFIEAPCPLRTLTPQFDHEVHIWLSLLAQDHFENLQNWIAQVTNLDLTCAALMLTGPKDTGKSLLAFGLSRLWSTAGPTPLVSAMSDFNDKLARCPLVFADEQLPKDFRGYGRTPEIREFISSRARPFKRKHIPEATILGAIRLIVAANNQDILAIQEHLSAHDISAINDRFYHIRVNETPAVFNGEIMRDSKGDPIPEPAFYLSMCDTKSFLDQDRIARHALWLRDNYPIRQDGRFLIQSNDKEFSRGLATRSGIRSAVCQWLVGYVKNPMRIDARGDYGVMIKRGMLLVRPETILDTWDTFVKNETVPPTGKLSQAVSELSIARHHLSKPNGEGSAHWREIDPEHLYAWAAQTGFAEREEIAQALSVDTSTRIQNRGKVI